MRKKPSNSTEAANLLETIGRRVREARQARGESRARLAQRAGLSPRFLAQLEGGTGNISILRLRDVAHALTIDWAALFAGVPVAVSRTPAALKAVPPPPDAAVLALRHEVASYLEARSADELLEVRDDLAARFAHHGGRLVALLGLRGAGKSSVGRTLAKRLRVGFYELDTLIEEVAGMQLAQLFELQGPRRYRQLERDTLRRFLATKQDGVLATGGGIVTEPETLALLRQRCLTVWLRATPEEHWERVVRQGDRRPMRGNPDAMQELRALLAAREPLYAQAHVTQNTSGATAAAVGRALAGVVREHYGNRATPDTRPRQRQPGQRRAQPRPPRKRKPPAARRRSRPRPARARG